MDDRRVGLIVRALRRRRHWRQRDLAAAAGVSQSTISRVERGHLGRLSLLIIRGILGELDARTELDVRWRGGLAERLLDETHAALGVTFVAILRRSGWEVIPEVTFQHYGERGSIDLFAFRQAERAVCIVELKSVVHSYEETQRRFDVKVRLAADIAQERLGWRPKVVGAVLVLEETSTNRRRLRAIAPLVQAGLPAGSQAVRAWLRAPVGAMRGVWFVTLGSATAARGRSPAPQRVTRRVAR